MCSVGLLNVNTYSGGVTGSDRVHQKETNGTRMKHLERSGQRTGHGILLIVGVVILRYAEIRLFLSGGKCELWYAFMAGLFCLEVALATDTHREAKDISGKVEVSSSPTAFPSDFSAQDRFLAEKTEEALVRGLELQAGRDGPKPGLPVFPLELAKKFRLENRPEGYFGETNIAGRPRSVMGARQFVKFRRLDRSNAAEMLKEFIYKEFLSRAHWMYPDGYPGDFTVEQSIYKTTDGVLGKVGPEQSAGCIDWRKGGQQQANQGKCKKAADTGPQVSHCPGRDHLVAIAEPEAYRTQPSPGSGRSLRPSHRAHRDSHQCWPTARKNSHTSKSGHTWR